MLLAAYKVPFTLRDISELNFASSECLPYHWNTYYLQIPTHNWHMMGVPRQNYVNDSVCSLALSLSLKKIWTEILHL